MTARRVALGLAFVTFAAALYGAAIVIVALSHDTHDSHWLMLWTILPVALGAAAIVAARRPTAGLMWVTVGDVCGFVVIAGFSIGGAFKYEALAVLAAGTVHLIAVRERTSLSMVPMWFACGACALCPALLAVDEIAFHGGQPAPALVWGSWLFAGIAALLVADSQWRRARSRS